MEDFTELVNNLKSYDWGLSGAPLLLIDAEIRKLVGNPEQLARLEAALLTVLQSDASVAAKSGVCKRLGLIATERSVAVLAPMLLRTETTDMARYSLERMPAPEVDAALRDSLGKTEGKTRIGIINAIGNRRDPRAAGALGPLLGNPDEATAQAAAWALGRIGGSEALRLLSAVRKSAQGRVRLEVLDASLVCARRLVSEGKKQEALAIYRELNAEGIPAPIRRAASLGLKSISA